MTINRRTFLAQASSRVAAISAMSGLALEPAQSSTAPEPPTPQRRKREPNVVLMICDDLGYGDLGCYGSKLPTPNLDKMAASGLRCTHFNAAHPVCSASRAGLLTGRYGLRSNTTGAFGPHSASGTSLDETLLSNLFRTKSYTTKAIGKWHLGDAPQYSPIRRGFDAFYGVPYSVDMKPLPLIRDTETIEPDTDREELTQLYTADAVKFISEHYRAPFFLYLAFSYPHDPARSSDRFKEKSRLGDFGDAVAEIDWSVGEIVKVIESKGLGADTLLLFTSDHGPWYQGNPGALRGRKASTFEGGFRVPMLAQWRGTIGPGRVVDNWISNLDILPTLCSICNLDLPLKPLDGTDMSAALIEGKQLADDKPILYFSPMGNRGVDLHCIRRREWKMRVAQGMDGEVYLNDRTTQSRTSGWLARPELYNLALDPSESYDVAREHPEIIASLLSDIELMMPTFPSEVIAAYTQLKARTGNITTPPGAAPRPLNQAEPGWSYEPKDRREF